MKKTKLIYICAYTFNDSWTVNWVMMPCVTINIAIYIFFPPFIE